MNNFLDEEFMQQVTVRSDELEEAEPLIDYENQSLIHLPFLGNVHFTYDKMGYICSILILFYWLYGTWSTFFVIILPHIADGTIHFNAIYFYGSISLLTIVSFFRASFADPGRVHKSWYSAAPYNADWTWCKICCIKRPNRAHHCRRCGHCTTRMDHHCPWINNCVGEKNHYLFIQLVFYAFIMSMVTLVLCMLHIYYIPPCQSCDPFSFTVTYNKILTRVMVIMSMMMTFAGCGLFFTHHISLHFDFTTIEWIELIQEIQKKKSGLPSKYRFPQIVKTCPEAYRDTCGRGTFLFYPFPCRIRKNERTLTHIV